MQAFQQLLGLKNLHLQSLKLMEAIDDENLEQVKQILNDVEDPKERVALMKKKTKLQRNCLHLACYYGCHQIVDYLIHIAELDDIKMHLWHEDAYGYDPANLCMVRGFRKPNQAVIRFEIASITKRYMIFKSLEHAEFPLGRQMHRSINNELHWACYHQDKESMKHTMVHLPQYITEPNEEGLFPMDLIMGFKSAQEESFTIDILETVLIYIFDHILSPYIEEIEKNLGKKPFEFLHIDDRFNADELNRRTGLAKKKKDRYQKNLQKKQTDQNSDKSSRGDRLKKAVESIKSNKVSAVNSGLVPLPAVMVGSLKEKLNKKKKFLYHLLLWCMVADKKTYIKKLVEEFQLNPFRITVFDKNCAHVAAQYNRIEALRPILRQEYVVKGKLVRRKEKMSWVNMASHETGETPMHYAMANSHYDMAVLLIQSGAECGWMNSRGLKPLDVHEGHMRTLINQEWDKVSRQNIFSKEGKSRIEKLEREAFLTYSSGYQVVIVANLEKNLKYTDMLLCQMIKKAGDSSGIKFEYDFFQSIADSDKIFIGLKFHEQEINSYADAMQLSVYNLKTKFTLAFRKEKHTEYEVLRNRHIQLVIEYILKERLGIKSFEDLGQLDTYYFLHDFGRLSSLQSAWQLWSFLTYSAIFNELKKLNKVNMIFNYFGIEYGIMTGFLLTIKSYIHYMVVVLIAYAVVYYYVSREVEPSYITLPFMGFLWIFVVLTAKGWERREGDHFSMLGFTQKDFGRRTYEESFRIDYITGKITNVRIGIPLMRRIFAIKPITLTVLLAILCFFYYDAIVKKYFFNRVFMLEAGETYFSAGLLGILTALAGNLMIVLSAGWSSGSDSMIIDIIINIVFLLVAPAVYIQSIKKNDNIEEVFFACFYCGSMIIHLLIFDVSSIAAYYLRRSTLSKKWNAHYEVRLKQFKDTNIGFSDYGKEADQHFEDFKVEMITHRQFEYNDKMLPPLDILPEFYSVFCMFLTFIFFSVFYPITCISFFFFLVLKVWLFVQKSIRCYRRPKDFPREAIRTPAKLLIFTSYALPAFFSLLLLLKTGFFQRLRTSTELTLTQYKWANFTEPQSTLLIYLALEHVLLLFNFLVLSVIPSTSAYAQTTVLREQVYRRQHFERLNASGQTKDTPETKLSLQLSKKESMFPPIGKKGKMNAMVAVAGSLMSDESKYKKHFAGDFADEINKKLIKDNRSKEAAHKANQEVIIDVSKLRIT